MRQTLSKYAVPKISLLKVVMWKLVQVIGEKKH
jgi:hypothetical protein